MEAEAGLLGAGSRFGVLQGARLDASCAVGERLAYAMDRRGEDRSAVRPTRRGRSVPEEKPLKVDGVREALVNGL